VLQVIVNVVDFGMNLQQAVDAPRFHHQWLPDKIAWEMFEFSADTQNALERIGHVFELPPGYPSDPRGIGDAESIGVDPKTGDRLGASDPRRGGAPVGW
jgi:gamma-glutamyltranspeptidase / glutathione hydrolase